MSLLLLVASLLSGGLTETSVKPFTVPAGALEPAVIGPQEEAEAEEKPQLFGYGWKGGVSAGLTILAGNSRSTSAYLDARAEGVRMKDAESIHDRITLNAGYLGARQKDPDTGLSSTTARKAYGSAKYDRFLSEKLFGFGTANAEKDGVRDLELLWSVAAGVGYQWIQGDTTNLHTEVGIGYTEEDFKDDTVDEEYVSGRAALHFDHQISENASVFHDTVWTPSLEDFDEDHLIHSETGVRAGIVGNLSMEAKVIWDWDSSPATGRGTQDVKYVLGLNWTF